MAVSRAEIEEMSVSDRLDLIDLIWSTISEHPESLHVSEELGAELDRRIEAYRRHPELSESWDQLRTRLDSLDE
jgi:putative addiction module component (TIGR02574 family)